jgi:MFS family permease
MVAQTIGRVPLSDVTRSRLTVAALGLAVGLVLSDSSIVILALPEILDRFRVPIDEVSWVLTLFNLVLALVALPAAYLARRRAPGAVCSLGLAVFAAASLGCALSPSFGWLLAARGVQAVGGAAAVCAALELLAVAVGSERRAAAVWAAAGGLGAAAGPAIGGILTDTISWKAIFVAQVPLALAALALVPHRAHTADHGGKAAGRPAPAANLALALLSAALTAALFLIVLLLINGWGHSPLSAAVIVSVMPLAALAGYRLLPATGTPRMRGAAGAILVGGGLAALAVLPGASWGWLIAPQLAIGAGLALAIGALTEEALAGRSPIAIHGGWTIASRHAGVCIGLLLLTPIFTGDLTDQQHAAELAGTRIILDSKLGLSDKLDLGNALVEQIQSGPITRPPDLHPAFEKVGRSAEASRLEAAIQDQVDRAVTHAFSASFLVAALLAMLAALPLAWARVRP